MAELGLPESVFPGAGVLCLDRGGQITPARSPTAAGFAFRGARTVERRETVKHPEQVKQRNA
jgi:hypothetical protein